MCRGQRPTSGTGPPFHFETEPLCCCSVLYARLANPGDLWEFLSPSFPCRNIRITVHSLHSSLYSQDSNVGPHACMASTSDVLSHLLSYYKHLGGRDLLSKLMIHGAQLYTNRSSHVPLKLPGYVRRKNIIVI